MSISEDSLTVCYDKEGLASPAILPWPLDGEAENQRAVNAKRFATNLETPPPPGLSWMSEHRESKYRPEKIVTGCRSIWITHLGYFRNDEIDEAASQGVSESPALGRVARYARGRDYHKELGKRLKRIAREMSNRYPGESFRSFTDIGPLDEVWLAEAVGAAFRGRNGLAIFPKVGSWAVIGHILSTMPVDTGPPRSSPLHCPDGCRRCIDACPTQALVSPGRIDPSRCISYLTIEHSGSVDEKKRSDTGDWIFGCDVCQEVCPYNYQSPVTEVDGFRRNIAGPSLDLLQVLRLGNRDDFVGRFAGSPLMRPGREGLIRNACTAAGNSGCGDFLPLLELLQNDIDRGIAEHAAWAMDKLRKA